MASSLPTQAEAPPDRERVVLQTPGMAEQERIAQLDRAHQGGDRLAREPLAPVALLRELGLVATDRHQPDDPAVIVAQRDLRGREMAPFAGELQRAALGDDGGAGERVAIARGEHRRAARAEQLGVAALQDLRRGALERASEGRVDVGVAALGVFTQSISRIVSVMLSRSRWWVWMRPASARYCAASSRWCRLARRHQKAMKASSRTSVTRPASAAAVSANG